MVSIDTSGASEGQVEVRGHMGPSEEQPLARDTMEIVVDRTAPVMTMHEPQEGEGLCVERDGLMERALLKFTIADAVESVEVRGVWRRYGDGEWVPLCVGDDCEDEWGEPETGEVIEHYWVVNGLPDGEYTIRFELCDRYGNRSTFERRFTIFRGVTAIAITEVENPRFSPNGDGRADVVTATVRLPQPLRMTVQVRAGSRTVRSSGRSPTTRPFPAGDRPFAWDGLNDQGAFVPRRAVRDRGPRRQRLRRQRHAVTPWSRWT